MGFEVDERIHECIRPLAEDDDWHAASQYLDELPNWAPSPDNWKGAGHYLYWEWAGGWGETYHHIYYCPICGVKLDA